MPKIYNTIYGTIYKEIYDVIYGEKSGQNPNSITPGQAVEATRVAINKLLTAYQDSLHISGTLAASTDSTNSPDTTNLPFSTIFKNSLKALASHFATKIEIEHPQVLNGDVSVKVTMNVFKEGTDYKATSSKSFLVSSTKIIVDVSDWKQSNFSITNESSDGASDGTITANFDVPHGADIVLHLNADANNKPSIINHNGQKTWQNLPNGNYIADLVLVDSAHYELPSSGHAGISLQLPKDSAPTSDAAQQVANAKAQLQADYISDEISVPAGYTLPEDKAFDSLSNVIKSAINSISTTNNVTITSSNVAVVGDEVAAGSKQYMTITFTITSKSDGTKKDTVDKQIRLNARKIKVNLSNWALSNFVVAIDGSTATITQDFATPEGTKIHLSSSENSGNVNSIYSPTVLSDGKQKWTNLPADSHVSVWIELSPDTAFEFPGNYSPILITTPSVNRNDQTDVNTVIESINHRSSSANSGWIGSSITAPINTIIKNDELESKWLRTADRIWIRDLAQKYGVTINIQMVDSQSGNTPVNSYDFQGIIASAITIRFTVSKGTASNGYAYWLVAMYNGSTIVDDYYWHVKGNFIVTNETQVGANNGKVQYEFMDPYGAAVQLYKGNIAVNEHPVPLTRKDVPGDSTGKHMWDGLTVGDYTARLVTVDSSKFEVPNSAHQISLNVSVSLIGPAGGNPATRSFTNLEDQVELIDDSKEELKGDGELGTPVEAPVEEAPAPVKRSLFKRR